MRQGVLAGRTAGLRPAERRRLERICHRRHPADAVAERLTLQRLADEAGGLDLPLTLVVEGSDKKRQSVEVKAQVRALNQAGPGHAKDAKASH